MAWLRAIFDRTILINLAVAGSAFALFYVDNRARDVALKDVQYFNGWVLVSCLVVLMLLTLRGGSLSLNDLIGFGWKTAQIGALSTWCRHLAAKGQLHINGRDIVYPAPPKPGRKAAQAKQPVKV